MRDAIPKKIKEQVKKMFGGKCAYCGQTPDKLVIDHIHPVSKSHHIKTDINDISNLYPACFSCNNYKMNCNLEVFRSELGYQVHRARDKSVNFRLAERFGQIKITPSKIEFYFEKEKQDLET